MIHFNYKKDPFASFRRSGSPLNDQSDVLPDFITQLLDEQPEQENKSYRSAFTAPQTPNSVNMVSEQLSFNDVITEPITPHNASSTHFIPRNQKICKYYQMGMCKYGEHCKFLHIRPNSTERFSTNSHLEIHQHSTIPLRDISYDFPTLCKDQNGCRYLQQQLDNGNPQTTTLIFDGILPSIVPLMSDPFGNYLCQKLIETSISLQRIEIIKSITSSFFLIFHVIFMELDQFKKLISCYSTKDELQLLIKAIKPHVVELILDSNGNHVIQECLKTFNKNDNSFIFDAIVFKNNLPQISTHKHGCCVVQRCIDNGNRQQLIHLTDEIVKHALQLVQDAYGNYVVQYVLKVPLTDVVYDVTKQIQEDLIELSMQKFSSNVVEKLVCSDDYGARELIFEKFLSYKNVTKLLQDSYANYVIQTCLDYSSDSYHQRFATWLNPHLNTIRNTPYCKKIQSKLHRDKINNYKHF
ncbi:Pumilio domain-containing protein C6G9.14 [Entamoeba marina]